MKGIGKGKVTTEDAIFMLVEFENGTLGSFEATVFSPSRENYNYFEIYGSRGSILFNFERMNELEFFSQDDPDYAQGGFKIIPATEQVHPYIANWWPPGHIIGYEHEFIQGVADFLGAIAKNGKIEPNFYDGMKCQQVLDTGLKSAETGGRIALK